MRRERGQRRADRPRLINHPSQILARKLRAFGEAEDDAFEALRDQIILKRLLVLEIDLRLAAANLIEWWLRDIEIPALDQFRHLPVEEGEQERADMRAVHVSVGHQHDLVVAQLVDVELVTANASAERHHQIANLLR